jgi:uncharacterized Zn finger protein
MPTRRWDDPWQQYPESVPLPTEDGIATSRQRGAMAASWWSRRFVDVLESYGLGTRIQRGRRYARAGQVLSFDMQPGMLVAQVQGSRKTPYVVTIAAGQPTPEQWASVDAALISRVGFVARLLAGEVPADLEDVFRDASVDLFPAAWSTLDARCNCPDWENPCKHIAAVLYLFADQLDRDPWLLLTWRGRSRDQLLDPIRTRAGSAPTSGSAVAPWWPFAHGAPLRAGLRVDEDGALVEPPDPPDAALRRLTPLDVDVRGKQAQDLLSAAYEAVCGTVTDAHEVGVSPNARGQTLS